MGFKKKPDGSKAKISGFFNTEKSIVQFCVLL